MIFGVPQRKTKLQKITELAQSGQGALVPLLGTRAKSLNLPDYLTFWSATFVCKTQDGIRNNVLRLEENLMLI